MGYHYKSFSDFSDEWTRVTSNWMRFLLRMSLIYALVYAYSLKMFNLIFKMSNLLLSIAILFAFMALIFKVINLIMMYSERRSKNNG